jgi:hypothetical protein
VHEDPHAGSSVVETVDDVAAARKRVCGKGGGKRASALAAEAPEHRTDDAVAAERKREMQVLHVYGGGGSREVTVALDRGRRSSRVHRRLMTSSARSVSFVVALHAPQCVFGCLLPLRLFRRRTSLIFFDGLMRPLSLFAFAASWWWWWWCDMTVTRRLCWLHRRPAVMATLTPLVHALRHLTWKTRRSVKR